MSIQMTKYSKQCLGIASHAWSACIRLCIMTFLCRRAGFATFSLSPDICRMSHHILYLSAQFTAPVYLAKYRIKYI